MSYVAYVLSVMIASPSDLPEARNAVQDAIYEWNQANSRARNVILQPWRWETSAVPLAGGRAQSMINTQGVDRSDIVIALFGSRLGSPTSEAVSGTAEEIERAVDLGKPVHVYFSSAALPSDVDIEQLAALRDFKKVMQTKGLLGEFSAARELNREVWKAIEHDLDSLNLQNSAKNPREELSRSHIQKDLLLLEERMRGWEMHGAFHVGLRDAFHKHLPRTFVGQLEEQVDRWDGDTRYYHDEEIAQAWFDCKSAAEAYLQKINFYMSYEDETSSEYLQVPPELRNNTDRGETYRKVFEELESARSALLESLGVLYRVHHSKALPAPEPSELPSK